MLLLLCKIQFYYIIYIIIIFILRKGIDDYFEENKIKCIYFLLTFLNLTYLFSQFLSPNH